MARLTPLFDDEDIDRFFDKFQKKADAKFIETLKYAGETGVKIARESGRYNDITGNLRSSIGYAILKEGKPLYEDYTEGPRGTDRKTGVQRSKRLVEQVSKTAKTGFALILVAGMDYALYVENMDNKDVLSGAVTETEKFLRETLNKIVND